MRGEVDAIRDAGGELVFIGNGTPAMAAEFERLHAGGSRVLTDPSLKSHAALGMARGVGATLGLASVLNGVRAAFRGHRQGRLAGDAWQQGGLFVLDRDGSVVYRQVNLDSGMRPDLRAILAALTSLSPATRKPQTA